MKNADKNHARGRPLRVLVVEDDKERIEALLGIYMYHDIAVAESAQDANEFLSQYQFDVVHLDYDLNSTLTGADVAASIPEQNKSAVIIIHSDNPSGVDCIKALLPDAYPISISEFLSKNEFSSRLKALYHFLYDIQYIIAPT
jgi:DNA-binding NtrC family response regulator